MKKLLLLSAIAFSAVTLSAQVLEAENFETMSVGNLTTDLTGATPGQNGWYTFSSAGGTNNDLTNYQIVNKPVQGKVLQITGSNAAAGTKYAFRYDAGDNWQVRDAGNDILIVQYKFYTGTGGGTNFGALRSVVYDGTGTIAIAGLSYDKNTKLLKGLAYYDNVVGTTHNVGNYIFNLSPTALTDNTWYTVAYTFDYSTGEINWVTPGGNYTTTGAAAGTDPSEQDFISTVAAGNTVAHVGMVDDLQISATADYALLGTKSASLDKAGFSVFPNPTTDYLNVNASKISSIEIFDIAGKSLKVQKSAESKVNVTNLQPGVYLIKVTSASGVSTQKFIKK